MNRKELNKSLIIAADLLELENKILNMSLDIGIDIFIQLIKDFYSGVDEIRNTFLDFSAVPISDIDTHPETVEFLQSILNNEKFEDVENKRNLIGLKFLISKSDPKGFKELNDKTLNTIINNSSQEVLDKFGELMNTTESDLNSDYELADNHLYSWFGPYSYVQDLRKAGSILIKTGELPENFHQTITTIKQCFAFQQYLAVIVLCRTSMEIALWDLYNKLDFTTKGSSTNSIAYSYFISQRENKKRKYANEYQPSPQDLRTLICKLPEYSDFEEQLGTLYGDLSSIVHGRGDNTKLREAAKKYMKEVYWLIYDLYNKLP